MSPFHTSHRIDHLILFAQLKAVFHMLESLGSARIEGNHTTLADYVESKVEGTPSSTDQLKEINNIEAAMEFIDEHLNNGDEITEYFIRELHSLAVVGLQQEGDTTPSAYRQHNVSIAQSDHLREQSRGWKSGAYMCFRGSPPS